MFFDGFLTQSGVLLILRILLGILMIWYGYPKIKDLESNARDFIEMGFKPGSVWGTVVAFVEFFGGIAVLFGFFAEIAAALFAFQMLAKSLWKQKMGKPIKEWFYDLSLLSIALLIVTLGAGRFALIDEPISLHWSSVSLIVLGAYVIAHVTEIFGVRYLQWHPHIDEGGMFDVRAGRLRGLKI